MSHLPEVEVLRKDLEKEMVGKRVKDVTVKAAKLVGRHRNRPEFVNALTGRKLQAVRRLGTWLFVDLDEGLTLGIRLGAHGILTRETASAESGPHTQVVLTFTTGGALHLVDPDKAAELFVLSTGDLAARQDLVGSGIDPLSGTFTWQAFANHLVVRPEPLKTLLLDESFVLGLGDLYADEILWVAGLSGARMSDTLSSQEIRRLYRAMFEVLYEAVKQGGTSQGGEEAEHTDLFGEPGEYGSHIAVYGRDGQSCPRCRRPIARTVLDDGNVLYHCTSCQA